MATIHEGSTPPPPVAATKEPSNLEGQSLHSLEVNASQAAFPTSLHRVRAGGPKPLERLLAQYARDSADVTPAGRVPAQFLGRVAFRSYGRHRC